jgi:hypothetical protein
MSLKYFHLIFLFFAILCDTGFWLWTHLLPETAASMGVAGLGMFAGWMSLVLVGYGIWYIVKKSRTIIV